jgi:hypothetical protein
MRRLRVLWPPFFSCRRLQGMDGKDIDQGSQPSPKHKIDGHHTYAAGSTEGG